MWTMQRKLFLVLSTSIELAKNSNAAWDPITTCEKVGDRAGRAVPKQTLDTEGAALLQKKTKVAHLGNDDEIEHEGKNKDALSRDLQPATRCIDVEPPTTWKRNTCQKQKTAGNCNKEPVLSRGLCAKTCGHCQATPGTAYVLGEPGVDDCPVGSTIISNIPQCKLAAAALGKKWRGGKKGQCYIASGTTWLRTKHGKKATFVCLAANIEPGPEPAPQPEPELDGDLTPAPSPACGDTPDWANPYGYGCIGAKSYEANGWCADGSTTPGSEWTLGEKFGYPEKHCCICGKTSLTPTPASRAPTPTPPKPTKASPTPTLTPLAPTRTPPVRTPAPRVSTPTPLTPAPPPQAFTPAPPAPTTPVACEDTYGWINPYQLRCADYESDGWCAHGGVVPGKEIGLGEAMRYPEKHCCVCGKQSRAPTTSPIEIAFGYQCEPTTYVLHDVSPEDCAKRIRIDCANKKFFNFKLDHTSEILAGECGCVSDPDIDCTESSVLGEAFTANDFGHYLWVNVYQLPADAPTPPTPSPPPKGCNLGFHTPSGLPGDESLIGGTPKLGTSVFNLTGDVHSECAEKCESTSLCMMYQFTVRERQGSLWLLGFPTNCWLYVWHQTSGVDGAGWEMWSCDAVPPTATPTPMPTNIRAPCQEGPPTEKELPGGTLTIASVCLDKDIAGRVKTYSAYGPSATHAVADLTEPGTIYFSWTEDGMFGDIDGEDLNSAVHVTKVRVEKNKGATVVGTASFDGFGRAGGIDITEDGIVGTICQKYVGEWARQFDVDCFDEEHGRVETWDRSPLLLAVCEVDSTTMRPHGQPWRIGQHWTTKSTSSCTAGAWGSYPINNNQGGWLTYAPSRKTWTAFYKALVCGHDGSAMHTYARDAPKVDDDYGLPTPGVENRYENTSLNGCYGTGDHQQVPSAMRYHPQTGDIGMQKRLHGLPYMVHYGLGNSPGFYGGEIELKSGEMFGEQVGSFRACDEGWIMALVSNKGHTCAKMSKDGQITTWKVIDANLGHPKFMYTRLATLGSKESEAKCGAEARFLMGYETAGDDVTGDDGNKLWLVEVDGNCDPQTTPADVTGIVSWSVEQEWTTTQEGAVSWVTAWKEKDTAEPDFSGYNWWSFNSYPGRTQVGNSHYSQTHEPVDKARVIVYWPK